MLLFLFSLEHNLPTSSNLITDRHNPGTPEGQVLDPGFSTKWIKTTTAKKAATIVGLQLEA